MLGLHQAFCQQAYQKPPKAVLDVLNAPLSPTVFIDPTARKLLLAQPSLYPSIADMAEPILKLAGVRVNPRTNMERSYIFYWESLTLKDIATGKETSIKLPPVVKRIDGIKWNASGNLVAFINESDSGVELWVLDAATCQAKKIEDIRINPLLDNYLKWMPDQQSLLVKTIPQNRGLPPKAESVPPGPKIMESAGSATASSTYEARDVLKTPGDADLFDYYATSQLAIVRLPSGKVEIIGQPAIYDEVEPSPDGRYLLVNWIHRPYSYQRSYERFPQEVEVWSADGKMIEHLASQPLAEQVPIDGEITGPREHAWRPTADAKVIWAEALDGGDPENKVPHRDCLMQKTIGQPSAELCRIENRYYKMRWIQQSGKVLVWEYDRDRKWFKVYMHDVDDAAQAPRLVWDMSIHERYQKPGDPVTMIMPNGVNVVRRQGDWLFLSGQGSSPEGDRPFLDRIDLNTLKTERLFRSDKNCYETYYAWIDPEKGTFITRRESSADPPNYFKRRLDKKPLTKSIPGEASWRSSSRVITRFPDPAPILRQIKKQIVTYEREDGLPLSFTLYLPPGYKKGTRLPTLLWAYPSDLAQKEVAGQLEGSSQRFTTIRGTSELFFLLGGYAVLDDASMPVVGPPGTAYDGFVEQIAANAKAAVAKAVEMGVTDPNRVGVAGHSHGALMTANLLAYTDIFRAGIARSGAYNHTLRPFGYQNEKRTLWQAKDTYIKNSPVLQADKINEPLLIIHGEIDANPGTVPLQSEKLYDAVRGAGGTARLVMLPYENHGYIARESVEHVLYEMLSWFDRYVKNAPAR
ncbi:MAG: prolyl oligopeptidase family serine peptidase [Candidatus Edwardsbacteria bacterium]|nr:prolyl oligopeptidase family serine peptidase [Candidatus Edwardsbacteria bacterium]